jgi:hypothetical protein
VIVQVYVLLTVAHTVPEPSWIVLLPFVSGLQAGEGWGPELRNCAPLVRGFLGLAASKDACTTGYNVPTQLCLVSGTNLQRTRLLFIRQLLCERRFCKLLHRVASAVRTCQ